MTKYSVGELFHRGQIGTAADAMRLAERRCGLCIKNTHYDQHQASFT